MDLEELITGKEIENKSSSGSMGLAPGLYPAHWLTTQSPCAKPCPSGQIL